MKKIIVADDSRMARAYIKRILSMVLTESVEVIEAGDGREAFARMKECRPDLLITDLNMPEMDGATLLKRVKASPVLHGTPCIVVTSLLNPEKQNELQSYDARAILGKPLNAASLSRELAKIFKPEGQNDDYGW